MVAPPTVPVALKAGPYVLDGCVPADADAVAAALVDPAIALWNPGVIRPGTSARDRALLWIADRATWAADHASWVVRDLDGHVIGAVSVHHLDVAAVRRQPRAQVERQAAGIGVARVETDDGVLRAPDDRPHRHGPGSPVLGLGPGHVPVDRAEALGLRRRRGQLVEEAHQDRRSVKASMRTQASAQASFHSAKPRSKKECGAPS